MEEEQEKFIQDNVNKCFAKGIMFGLRRHTWMKDGVTYVGNGTYTLNESIEMLKKDWPELSKYLV